MSKSNVLKETGIQLKYVQEKRIVIIDLSFNIKTLFDSCKFCKRFYDINNWPWFESIHD